MELGLRGRTAIVCGGSAGIGLAVAEALIEEGANVAMFARGREQLEREAERLGALAVGGDVTAPADLEQLVRLTVDAYGGIDILVPNAGGPPAGDFAAIDDVDAYARAFELNALSTIAMCKAAVPAMQAQRWGRVVAITSISVRQPIPNLILSNTARAGVTGFLKTLAGEVAPDGVTVNSLQPGLHATDRVGALHGDGADLGAAVPVRRLGDPADFGAFVAFLCSDAANYVTGAAIPVDGGIAGGLQ